MSSERDKMLDMITEMNNWNYKKDKIIEDLQSQLDQANEKLNEHNEYFKEFNCKDFKEFQDFISLSMLTPHEKQTLIKELQNQLNQANERLKGAIVPKFKIGQEVWVVRKKIMTESYVAKFKVKAFIPDRYGIVLMLENEMGDIHYCYEWQVYITREEAEKKLQELRGGE